MRLAPYLSALCLGSLLLACSSTPASTTTIVRPTLVGVDPADFLGTQTCGCDASQVGSYVATLYDVTPASDGGLLPETGFPLPSSPPTSCFFPVTFSYVVVGHRYRALIEAYNRVPSDSVSVAGEADAAGCDATGSPITAVTLGGRLQQDGSMTRVAPRWTATCGGYPPTITDAGEPAVAAYITGADLQDAGDAAIPGVESLDTITRVAHDCGPGLVPLN